MTQQTTQIPVSSIILDEDIYPRKGIDHKRVGMFAENIRDGIAFDPIEVEPCPDRPGGHMRGSHVSALRISGRPLAGPDELWMAT